MVPADELQEPVDDPEVVRKVRDHGLRIIWGEAEVPLQVFNERQRDFVDSGDHEELEEPVGGLVFEAVGEVKEVLIGVEEEGFGGEADMGGGESGGDGEELLEDGGVLADEFDGAEGEGEGASDEGDREGLRGFTLDEVFEGD